MATYLSVYKLNHFRVSEAAWKPRQGSSGCWGGSRGKGVVGAGEVLCLQWNCQLAQDVHRSYRALLKESRGSFVDLYHEGIHVSC